VSDGGLLALSKTWLNNILLKDVYPKEKLQNLSAAVQPINKAGKFAKEPYTAWIQRDYVGCCQ
jgi:hypothetical protein